MTILRFFAASWVVLFHLQSRFHLAAAGTSAGNFLDHGAFAISLFFILSGIVLTCGYPGLAGGPDIKRFYLARFARIYPSYAVVHLIALFWFTPATCGWLEWLYVNLLSGLGLQAWVPHTFISNGINGGTWTISVEFFFYLLFPALLPALHHCHQRIGGFALGLGLVVLSGLLGLAEYIFGPNGVAIYYILPTHRLPEFMLGVTLGLSLRDTGRPRWPPWLNLGLALGAFLLVCANPSHSMPHFWVRYNILVVPILAWLLYAVARSEQHHQPAWRSTPARILIYLGDSSYCLFLAHLLPLLVLDLPGNSGWRDRVLAKGLNLEFALLVALASLALAFALHELVEKPARRHLLQWFSHRPKSSP